MAKKAQNGELTKSQAIRDVYVQNPTIKVKELIEILARSGIEVKPGLVYMVKGKMKGRKGRRRKMRRQVAQVMTNNKLAATSGDVLSTIKKVKGLAAELGGMKKLKALLEALSE